MSIYHFAIDITCEGNQSSRSTAILLEDSYTAAIDKLYVYVRNRPAYTGVFEDYDVVLEWIEHANFIGP